MELIRALMVQFPARSDASPADLMAGYELASAGIPLPHIKTAVAAFIAGKVPDHRKAFLPTPAQLGEYATKLWHSQLAAEERARKEREARQMLPPPKLTPEERERRRQVTAEGLAKLKAIRPGNEADGYDWRKTSEGREWMEEQAERGPGDPIRMTDSLRGILDRWSVGDRDGDEDAA